MEPKDPLKICQKHGGWKNTTEEKLSGQSTLLRLFNETGLKEKSQSIKDHKVHLRSLLMAEDLLGKEGLPHTSYIEFKT